MERVGAAAVILNGDGEVLLVHHTYGMLNWELPGGIGERGESPTETAVREVREEQWYGARSSRTKLVLNPMESKSPNVSFGLLTLCLDRIAISPNSGFRMRLGLSYPPFRPLLALVSGFYSNSFGIRLLVRMSKGKH